MELQRVDFQRIVEVMREYKVPLVLGSISVICIVISLFLLISSRQAPSPTTFLLGTATESGGIRSRTIKVDVAGGVIHPGVYSLGEGARIEDAIIAAGGLSQSVSTILLETSVNRAARVIDGGKVYIPEKVDEEEPDTSYKQNVQRVGNNTSHILESGQTGSQISINNASEQDLETLSGVGPATAAKIISGRPYTSLDQLLDKKVVGQKLYDKIKNQLTL
jgi:competence protein ComEA